MDEKLINALKSAENLTINNPRIAMVYAAIAFVYQVGKIANAILELASAVRSTAKK
jgi:hypothetical protein